MTEGNLLDPVDDAFIRTAIRGLRAPDHHPAFWGELTRDLDALDTGPPLVVPLPVLEPEPEPEPEPEREPEPEPAPARSQRQVHVPAPDVEPHPPRRQPLRARPPAHAAPAGAERVRAFTPGPTSPRAEAVVRHDAAVVPQSLRRSSNAVLLAIAVAAAVVALVAGLTLVRQRSDAGGPTPSDEPTQPAAAVVGAPANLS